MTTGVDELLARRGRPPDRAQLLRAFGLAIALHAGTTVALVVVPKLVAAPAQPTRFVAVQMVSARALGIQAPTPARATPPPPRSEPRPAATPRPTPSNAPTLRREGSQPRPASTPVATPEPEPEPAVGSPTGAASGVALGAAVAGLDNPTFTYGYYLDQMLALIQSRWVRPPLGSGIETTIAFRIERDGRLSELRIEQSSGYSSFDLAGLRAVQAASPLPPLPRSYTHGSLGVRLIFK